MFRSFSSPKFRSTLSQLCGILPYYCLKFVFGSSTGFHIILLAELYKKDSEIYVSLDQLTWLASLSFLALIGNLSTGLLIQRLGNRMVALATATLYISSELSYYYATNVTWIFIGQVLNKLAATNTLASPYISEVSEPHLRGRFLAIAHVSSGFGTFFSLLFGSLLYWRNIALVNLVAPIFGAVIVLITPNSPSWFASKRRFEEAEKSLCWLRGWVQPTQIQTEFNVLVDSVEKLKPNQPNLDAELANQKKCSSSFFQTCMQRSFYLPLFSMCLMFFLYESSGLSVVQGYSKIILENIDSPIDASIATVVMGALGIVGRVILMFSIHRIGKRKLVFTSVVIAIVCCSSIAIVGFFKLKGAYLWIPPIAIILAHFADTAGSGTILYMLVSEIFPLSVRYIGTSIGMAFSLVTSAVSSKLFLYVVDAITLHGIFFVFAVMNAFDLIIYYFVFPETEGRSLTEIEDHFKGVASTKEREK